LRVVLVEDEPLHQKLFAAWIERAGHQAIAVLDPRQAELVMLQHPPDIAIIDLHLPHIDGLKLIALWRRRRELSAVPIIAVTVLTDDYDERSCLLAGADMYVTKPFSRAELLAHMQQAANRTRNNRQGRDRPGTDRNSCGSTRVLFSVRTACFCSSLQIRVPTYCRLIDQGEESVFFG